MRHAVAIWIAIAISMGGCKERTPPKPGSKPESDRRAFANPAATMRRQLFAALRGLKSSGDAVPAAWSALAATGESSEPWTDGLMDQLSVVVKSDETLGGARVSRAGCFGAGCAAVITHSSQEAAITFRERFAKDDFVRHWKGGHVETLPHRVSDAEFVQICILVRPST